MGRYATEIDCDRIEPEVLRGKIASYLKSRRFKPTVFGGEEVWRKGGRLAHPRFVKLSILGNVVCIEAWWKFMVFPGVYVGEKGPAKAAFSTSLILQLTVDDIEAIARGELPPRWPHITRKFIVALTITSFLPFLMGTLLGVQKEGLVLSLVFFFTGIMLLGFVWFG